MNPRAARPIDCGVQGRWLVGRSRDARATARGRALVDAPPRSTKMFLTTGRLTLGRPRRSDRAFRVAFRASMRRRDVLLSSSRRRVRSFTFASPGVDVHRACVDVLTR